jgi:molecular chaperone GrpE (heat shock protein)
MIAELAAANAAFDVIKQTLANGKEIYEAGEAMATYFGLKTEIQKRAHQHGYKSDIAAFMAAEQLAANEQELKEIMIYQGRAGMWDDWLQFQAEIKRSREEEEREKRLAIAKRRAVIIQTFLWTGYSIAALLIVVSGVSITLAILKYT